jgi:hypothetical protein
VNGVNVGVGGAGVCVDDAVISIVGTTKVRVGETVVFRLEGIDGSGVNAMAVGVSSSGKDVGDGSFA